MTAKRLDEVLESVEWAMGRDAESKYFPQVPGTLLRRAKTDPFPGTGVVSLLAFFTVDDDEYCTIHAIVEAPSPHL